MNLRIVYKSSYTKFLSMNTLKSVGFFVCLLLVSRLIPHPPNFTPLIAGIIFLPFILEDKRFVIIVPILVMLISDFIIGFHSHMLWTYGAFLLISLGVLGYFQKKVNRLLILSVLSPTLFYLLTNFGVWTSSSIYSNDIVGLIECYTLAIPFYANNLISTIIFLMAFTLVYNYMGLKGKRASL